jgi:hypothetical protein
MSTSTPTTHRPATPEPLEHPVDDAAPNPTQLPVEPEFGPMLPPGEPEEPGVATPHL